MRSTIVIEFETSDPLRQVDGYARLWSMDESADLITSDYFWAYRGESF